MMREDQNVAFYGSNSRPQDLTSLPEPPNAYEAPSQMREPLHNAPIDDGPPIPQERRKNFPPCKPMVHHDIKNDIQQDKRMFVRKAYFGWYVHCFCILYNFVCFLGAVVKGGSIIGFFVALAILLLGVPVSFFVYMLLYNAIRLTSSSRFCLWFGLFALQVGVEGLYMIGISSTGGVGLLMMLDAFTSDHTALGVMFGIAFGLWLLIFLYNIWFFNQAREQWRNLGGTRAATKEISHAAVTTAYENRGTIKEFAVEHKDTIKQVAYENKDAIIDFAKENKEVIGQVAYENRHTIARAAVDNKDLLFENQDVVASVFEDPKQ